MHAADDGSGLVSWRVLLGGLALGVSGALFAHAGHEPDWRPQLLPLDAPALQGMRVDLVHTLAPQLVVHNPTNRQLEVLAADGQPFLRLGPRGVEANVRHPTWFDTYLPGGLPTRQPEPGTGPDWRQVNLQPTWGWFDERLRPALIRAETRWQVALRVDGQPVSLRGRFVPSLAPGLWQARWRQAPALPAGVAVSLVPGQPHGVMVSTRGPTVLVQDRDHQPFLRISPRLSEAHTGSRLWQETTTQPGLLPAGTAAAGWRTIGGGGRHVWVEPRTQPSTDQRGTHHWHINLLVDDQPVRLEGLSEWSPRP